MNPDDIVEDADVMYCSSCMYPVTLHSVPTVGLRLACGCEDTQVDVEACLADSALTEPLSGKWSGVDQPDLSTRRKLR